MILKFEFDNFFSIRNRIRIDLGAASINTALDREFNLYVMNGVSVLSSVESIKQLLVGRLW